MSEKQVKAGRRAIRKESDRIVKEFMRHVYTRPFFDRLRLAWVIIRKK